MFSSAVDPAYPTQVDRLNGVRQQEETAYAPSFQNPQTPVPGSISVNTLYRFSKTFRQIPSFSSQLGVEHEFTHHWHAKGDFNYTANWDHIRVENVNAPMVASSIGVAPDPIAALLAPRPIAPNENIFLYEKLAHMRGRFLVLSLEQNDYKRFGLSAFYVHMAGVSDGGFRGENTSSGAANPQSSYGQQGESSRVDWQTSNLFGLMGNVNLPLKTERLHRTFRKRWHALQHHLRHGCEWRRQLQRPAFLRFYPGPGGLQHAIWIAHHQHGKWQCSAKHWDDARNRASRHEPEPRLHPPGGASRTPQPPVA